ncbi:MAG: hypothetical protein ABI134_31385 [Byssovorax sp.]
MISTTFVCTLVSIRGCVMAMGTTFPALGTAKGFTYAAAIPASSPSIPVAIPVK